MSSPAQAYVGRPLPRVLQNVRRINSRALRMHAPGDSPCPVSLYRRSDGEDSFFAGPLWERLRGWLPTPQDPGPASRPLPTPWRRDPDPRGQQAPRGRPLGTPG